MAPLFRFVLSIREAWEHLSHEGLRVDTPMASSLFHFLICVLCNAEEQWSNRDGSYLMKDFRWTQVRCKGNIAWSNNPLDFINRPLGRIPDVCMNDVFLAGNKLTFVLSAYMYILLQRYGLGHPFFIVRTMVLETLFVYQKTHRKIVHRALHVACVRNSCPWNVLKYIIFHCK